MINLKKVDSRNVWKLLRLEVSDSQKDFVATNTESIIEAYTTIVSGGVAMPFGIYDGNTPVGFLMIGYGSLPDDENPSVAEGNYCLWRLMIDRQYQGKGYGKAAIRLALDYIRSFPCGRAEKVWLSYEPDNTAAKQLYSSFGFTENGETDGDETVAVLRLGTEDEV